MTGSITQASGANAAGSAAAANALAANSAAAASAAIGGAAASGTGGALAQLSGNESTFLNLLLVQLKNQDPTTPLDTNQFTSELVQYSQVEQQINTNSNLSQLITLTQSGDLAQASQFVGKQVDLSSHQIPLQNGKGELQFTAPSSEVATIAITNAAGAPVKTVTVAAQAGSNTWAWDGTSDSGQSVPDGPYTATVLGADATGATSPLSFTVIGTATGLVKSGNGLSLQLGPADAVDLGSVVSVLN